MIKYIDTEKLIAEIERRIKQNEALPHRYIRLDEDKQLLSFITSLHQEQREILPLVCPYCMKSFDVCKDYSAYHIRVRYICPHCGYDGDSTEFETSYNCHPIHKVARKTPTSMIQWTGFNLKEVIDFTGKSPRLEEWFNSWEEYENYVHSHDDILKIFCDDGSHYEVPVGAWIVKTPDGHNVPSVAKYVQRERTDMDLEKEIEEHAIYMPHGEFASDNEILEDMEWARKEFRHFYELGLKAKKED